MPTHPPLQTHSHPPTHTSTHCLTDRVRRLPSILLAGYYPVLPRIVPVFAIVPVRYPTSQSTSDNQSASALTPACQPISLSVCQPISLSAYQPTSLAARLLGRPQSQLLLLLPHERHAEHQGLVARDLAQTALTVPAVTTEERITKEQI